MLYDSPGQPVGSTFAFMRGIGMSDTNSLVSRISAFRERLDRLPRLSPLAPIGEARTSRNPDPVDRPPADKSLIDRVEAGTRSQAVLDDSVRQLARMNRLPDDIPLELTHRARRVLGEARTILGELRTLADHPLLGSAIPGDTIPASPAVEEVDPLLVHYRQSVSLMDAAIRLMQQLPESPASQLRLCEGLEGLMRIVRQRLGVLRDVLARRGTEHRRIDFLTGYLLAVRDGYAMDPQPLIHLASEILAEDGSVPLRMLAVPPQGDQLTLGGVEFPPGSRSVACHCLNTARVLSRIVRGDGELRDEAMGGILAALLHDVGMLSVPTDVLTGTAPLDIEQRRLVERHPADGAEMIRAGFPTMAGLADLVVCHHERHNGTGYPAGRTGDSIPKMARLMMAADVYAAQCVARPYRAGLDVRTAYTDTLMMGEKGLLDPGAIARFMRISFWPVGTVVELADGCVGVVLSQPAPKGSPAAAGFRPLLLLLTDGDGAVLPQPMPLNLAEIEGRTIVRTLPASERIRLLAADYPHWAL